MNLVCSLAYRDAEFLRHMYWDEQLCQREIAERLNVSVSVIGLWMRKLNIPKRDIALATHLGNANHIDLSDEAINFLSGCLLGDGNLTMNKSISAMYQHTNKHRAYIEWLIERLESFGIEMVGQIHCISKTYKQKHYNAYKIATRSYPELTILREKWYGPEGRQPPRDLRLTPLTIRQWFIDDGHYRHPRITKRKGRSYYQRGSVRLCNRSFHLESKLFLVDQLREFGLDGIIHPDYIYLPNKYTELFFSIIGPCPVPQIFAYKWPTGERGIQLDLF